MNHDERLPAGAAAAAAAAAAACPCAVFSQRTMISQLRLVSICQVRMWTKAS